MKDGLYELAVETRARIRLVSWTAALLWLIELTDYVVFSGGLDAFGVRPLSVPGLVGIVFAPLLHGGFGHLMANTIPWLFLGFLTSGRKRLDFWVVAVVSAFTAGLGSWLFGGAGTVHIGASGVVFGFLGFLMGRGFWERRFGSILLSLVVTALFGSMLWGMVPVVAGVGISWQAHLFGWFGGLIVARTLGRGLTDKQRG
ncbi:MAG: rhomboid family intramembrane serine protease [Deltaproteobacteria bacterium]|nr:rhomboid family intramembrane serine protease [Deltaproteobacteria bacterium]HCH66938.1 rhomboid family intramembrane serine protease [Deltaproteobacteria bacterium]